MRPNTLAVATLQREHTQKFIREALCAWRTKASCSIVPAERLHELFEELGLNPTERQINEMLQTAKLFARRGSNGLDGRCSAMSNSQMNGLTFGEFCVLAADIKRFRTQCLQPSTSAPRRDRNNEQTNKTTDTDENAKNTLRPADPSAPEVFLGGSCNPTTWRADVAVPTLNKLGISFFNPQVSDWTPDLIELEHRAKEKARVLFFVMDSETRATAACIEAAYISGQNAKHLVLVLHPYKSDQSICNEPISQHEYIDLKRNQQLLRELVNRRGLPVLDDIHSGLHQTRAILSGGNCFSVPQNIASKLTAVRRVFDRVADDKSQSPDRITSDQCKLALNLLGYSQCLLQMENLLEIVRAHRDMSQTNNRMHTVVETTIDFEEFCVLASYLTILHEGISESGCVSPIKGTNLPQPPIYLTNVPEIVHHSGVGQRHALERNILPSSSIDGYGTHRDSGTSSPIHPDVESTAQNRSHRLNGTQISSRNFEHQASDEAEEEMSDSNDSVFSSGSSIDSILNYNNSDQLTHDDGESLDVRDLYLGGSCVLRSCWRNEVVPLLNERNVTYRMPGLHVSLKHDQTRTEESDEPSLSAAKPLEPSSSNDSGIENGRLLHPIQSKNCSTTRRLFNPALLESSRVLLFVISNETRSLAPMTLAAHCIGLGLNVVLCVQMLPDRCHIGDEQLSQAAIKDYNRGRAYLIDLAERQQIPVFRDIIQAVDCAIEKVNQIKHHESS